MNNSDSRKTIPLFALLGVIGVYLMNAGPNGMTPVLADIATAYGRDFTEASMMTTVLYLAAVPMNLLANTIINKLGVKKAALACSLGMTVFGILPAFVELPFEGLLAVRACYGIFMGVGLPLGLSCATRMIADEGKRGTVIGWGMTASNVINIVMSMAAGFLAAQGLSLVWLVHLAFAVTFALAVLMPDPDGELALENAGGAEVSAAPAPQDEQIPGISWFLCAIFVLVMTFVSAFTVNISSLVVGEGIGTALDASTLFSLMCVGGMVVGLIFGVLNAKLGNRLPILFGVLYVAAFAGFAFTSSMPVYYVCSFLVGIAFIGCFSWMTTGISVHTPPAKTALVQGIANALNFVLMFAYNFVMAGLAGMMGMAGNVRFPFYVAVVFYALFLVVMIVWNLGSKEQPVQAVEGAAK